MGVMNYVKESVSKYMEEPIKQEARNLMALYASEDSNLGWLTPKTVMDDLLLNPSKKMVLFSVFMASECRDIVDKTIENVLNGIDDLSSLDQRYAHSRDSVKELVEKSNSKKKY